MTLAEIKAAARAAAFARRKAAFAARKPGDSALLAEVLAAHAGRVLAGYMPMRTEIDCLPAMAAHEGPVGVPVIPGPALPLVFRRWSAGAAMIAGEFGALIPEAGDEVDPDVLIVPLLAFDRSGFRLGYGGGFYDRTLAGLRAQGEALAIGVGFATQEVPQVPRDGMDARLDWVVTEREALQI